MPRAAKTQPNWSTEMLELARIAANEAAERVRQNDHDLLVKIEVKVDTMQNQINDLANTIAKRTDELEGEIRNRDRVADIERSELEKRIVALETAKTRAMGSADVFRAVSALISGGIGAAIMNYFLRR